MKSGVLVENFAVSEGTAQSNSTYVCGSSAVVSDNSSADVSETSLAASPSSGGSGTENDLSTTSLTPPVSSVSPSCVQSLGVQISFKGSWDQFLNFYKYLAESNRVANLLQVSISSSRNQISSEGSESDLLTGQISLAVYYKTKSTVSNQLVVKELASGTGFNQAVLKKLEEIVYSPYVEPAVSETGERNFFK